MPSPHGLGLYCMGLTSGRSCFKIVSSAGLREVRGDERARKSD
jgi:hypothetical protein